MLRYGKEFTLTQELLDMIATYMNDDIRERLHCEIAPCKPEFFLKEYLKRDLGFEELLHDEFGIIK